MGPLRKNNVDKTYLKMYVVHEKVTLNKMIHGLQSIHRILQSMLSTNNKQIM